MDDILLMGLGYISEWKVFDKVIHIFCESSGMGINAHKSFIHDQATNAELLLSVQSIFPYHMAIMDYGFKYLGLFLKPNDYLKYDWKWILRKFDQKISMWCYNWLSLGGE